MKKSIVGLITLICGLLGALGGQINKKLRRIAIASILTVLALIYVRNWWVLTIMSMAGVFSIGYGIPSSTDEGSALGQFWYNIFKNTFNWNQKKIEFFANIFTRGCIGFLIGLSLISIPIIKGNWFVYLLGWGLIKTTYALISWRDLGVILIKKIHLLWVDIIIYGIVGLISSILIIY